MQVFGYVTGNIIHVGQVWVANIINVDSLMPLSQGLKLHWMSFANFPLTAGGIMSTWE